MSDRAAYSNQNDAEDAAQGLLEAIARSDLLPAGELLRNIGPCLSVYHPQELDVDV